MLETTSPLSVDPLPYFSRSKNLLTVIVSFARSDLIFIPIPSQPIQHSPHACPIPTKPEKPPKPENQTNSQTKHGTRKHQHSPSPQRNKNTHKPLPQHYPTAATSTNKSCQLLLKQEEAAATNTKEKPIRQQIDLLLNLSGDQRLLAGLSVFYC